MKLLTDKDFSNQLKDKKTLVYFSKKNCHLCLAFEKEIEKINTFCSANLFEFCKVELETSINPFLVFLFGEYGAPTLVFFNGNNDGIEVPYPQNGYNSENVILFLKQVKNGQII